MQSYFGKLIQYKKNFILRQGRVSYALSIYIFIYGQGSQKKFKESKVTKNHQTPKDHHKKSPANFKYQSNRTDRKFISHPIITNQMRTILKYQTDESHKRQINQK